MKNLPQVLKWFLLIVFLFLSEVSRTTGIDDHLLPAASLPCEDFYNITCPFTLKGIQGNQGTCKHPTIELICKDNQMLLNISSKLFYIKDSRHERMQIVDPGLEEGNCSSVPRHILSYYDYEYLTKGDLGITSEWNAIIYLECSTGVHDSQLYVDTSPCKTASSSGMFSYVMMEPAVISDIKESCNVIGMTYIRDMGEKRYNYSDIHKELLKGFEVNWVNRYV